MEKDRKILNFLVLADIHRNQKWLDALKQWHQTIFKEKYDCILIGGDLDSVSTADMGWNIQQPACENSQAEVTKILKFIEEFLPGVPIAYVPGHEDVPSLYALNPLPKLSPNSTNVHKSQLIIDPSLQIIGIGGSIPGFSLDLSTNTRKPKPSLKGHPYKTDEEYGKDVIETFKKYQKPELQTIILTHGGPVSTSTAIDMVTDPKDSGLSGSIFIFRQSFLGSEILNQILIENDVLLNVHGHTHYCQGKALVNKTQVVNPGAIKFGMFAQLKLIRNKENTKWIYLDSQFYNLDF